MHKLYLGLGSNLGQRSDNLQQALAHIGRRIGLVHRVSSFIETEPQGFASHHLFLNAVCLVHTSLSPMQCLEQTQSIEKEMGRTHKTQNGQYQDRIIDIDLLLYDDVSLHTPILTLPHPRMNERSFVTIPLGEILGQEQSVSLPLPPN